MALTETMLADAESDVTTLAAVVNGAPTDPDVVSRTGAHIRTLAGVLADAETAAGAIVGAAGYEPPVAYANGLNIIRASQTVEQAGEIYAPLVSALPFVTGAVFDPAQWRLLVSKQLLTRAELKAAALPDGTHLYLIDGVKSGVFRFTSANVKPLCDADPNEGVYIKPGAGDGSTGAWVRQYDDLIHARWFGGVWDGVADDAAVINAAVAFAEALIGSNLLGYGGGVPGVQLPFAPNGIKVGATILLSQAIYLRGYSGGDFGGEATLLKAPAGLAAVIQIDGANAKIEGIHCVGPWVPNAGMFEGEFHGFKAHRRFSGRDLGAWNFQGDGFHINVSGGSGGDTEGNCNDVWIERITANSNRNGLYLAGADVNAGYFAGVDANYNRQANIFDNSFLGNTHPADETSGGGVQSEIGQTFPYTCSFTNGNIFYCVLGQEAWAIANSPPATATNNTGWRFWKAAGAATGYAPQWAPGMSFRAGGAYLSGRLNGQGLYPNPYTESDQPPVQLGQNDFIVGGQGALDALTRYVQANLYGVQVGPHLRCVGSISALSDLIVDPTTTGAVADSQLIMRNSNFYNTLVFQKADLTTYASFSISTALGNIYNTNVLAGAHYFEFGGATALGIGSTGLFAGTDNGYTCGQPSNRFSVVYAGTGTINTSDARFKKAIEPVSDAVLDAWEEVGWSVYQWVEAVEAKGADGARIHVGLIAQRVIAVFQKHKLDPFRYGLVCHDTWDDQLERVMEDYTVIETRGVPNPKYLPAMEKYAVAKKIAKEAKKNLPRRPTEPELIPEKREVTMQRHATDEHGEPMMRVRTKAGDRYGIRYEEALALEAAYQRRRADRQEKRLGDLETAVAQLLKKAA